MMKQITLRDLLGEPVLLYGLMDDAYCPNCGRGFCYPKETDAEHCPLCGWKVNWDKWHRMNDEGESND